MRTPWYVGQRVLIVAPSFLAWDPGRYLEVLFRARGITCRRFAYRDFASDDEANAQLLRVAAEWSPRVVVGLKLDGIRPETVQLLRARGSLVALWYVDCFEERVPEHIAALFPVVDVFLTTADGMLPRYRALAPTPAHRVSEGVYLPPFRPVPLSPALRRTYASQVAFIGNLLQPPVADERLALRRFRLLEAVCRRFGLKIWGVQGDTRARARWPHPQCPLIEWPAFHEEVVKICQAADVVLGINTVNTVYRYFSNRTFLTLAAGGFHLTHYVPGLETMFENRRHLVWFHDDDECLDLIAYYLPRPDARWRIAEEGRRWTRRRYGMRRQAGRILEILGAHLGAASPPADLVGARQASG